MDNISEFKYLWDGTDPGWVPLKIPNLDGYLVFNKEKMLSLLIEDDGIASQIHEEMMKHGSEIMSITALEIQDVTVEPLDQTHARTKPKR